MIETSKCMIETSKCEIFEKKRGAKLVKPVNTDREDGGVGSEETEAFTIPTPDPYSLFGTQRTLM